MNDGVAALEGKFSYVDPTTGEQWLIEWKNSEEAKAAWQQLSALKKNVERAEKTIKSQFEEWLLAHDVEHTNFSDGESVKRMATARLKYQKATLRKYLDEEEMDLVTEPVNTLVKNLFIEKAGRGELPEGAFKDVEDNADSSVSYSVRIVKSNAVKG